MDLEDCRRQPGALPLRQAMQAWLPERVLATVRAAGEELNREVRQVYWINEQGRRVVEIDRHSNHNRALVLRMREAQDAAEAAFLALLRAGQLVAWAREGSPVAPLRRIPADAWASLRLAHVPEGRASGHGVDLFAIHVAPAVGPAERPADWPAPASSPAPAAPIVPAGEPKPEAAAENEGAAPDHPRVASTIGAERRLENWLTDKMRANPDSPPGKAAIKAEAEAAGLSVSARAFLRAYANAVKVAQAPAWSAPGKKSKRRIETAG